MSDPTVPLREGMVREQIEARGVRDARVLRAMCEVPRHLFVDEDQRPDAYLDRPLPIPRGQAISQPFIVAYMAERLSADGRRVLEIGTGSGYQTAVLSRLASEVLSVEVEEELSHRAAAALAALGISNVRLRVGNGLRGWPEEAPFPRIIVTAGLERLPQALLDQLETGGRLLAPVGAEGAQSLVQVDRDPRGLRVVELMPVVFVRAHEAT